jgi:peptidoglycan hydrolase-like protein with peptidoglycan-binding domain
MLAGVAGLQRMAGNRAVGSLLAGSGAPGRRAAGAQSTALQLQLQRATPVVQRTVTSEQAEGIATRLHDAMDRLGTDEEAIYGALAGRTDLDMTAIRTAYGPLAMTGDLDSDLRDELTDSEFAHVQQLLATSTATPPDDPETFLSQRLTRVQDVARQLDEAMRGLGTDESQLLNSLQGRAPFEVVEIAREYGRITGRSLLDDVRDELSGDDLTQALQPLTTMFAEGDGPKPAIGLLQQSLNTTGATPPLRITAMFTSEVTTALAAFQSAHPPLVANGRLTLETWLKLDELAPLVARSGAFVVESGTPAEARGVSTTGTIHPTVRMGNRGAAVEELQQKLLTVPEADVPTRPTANGRFQASTRDAVRELQGSRTPPLPISGIADAATWTALDSVAGPVTVGREEFSSNERVEGSQYGGPTRFTWRLLPDRLEVTVNIRFTGAPNHPRVSEWRRQMMDTWNVFTMVDDDRPGTRLPLRFVVGSAAPADATVRVTVTPQGEDAERSNAGHYHTGDTDPGLAPHEFGHLLGLQDEYNTGPEQYTIITGEQPMVGALEGPTDGSGNPVEPETIAREIRAEVTTNPRNTRGERARGVVEGYRLAQGAFAQRVGIAYERLYAGQLQREDNGPHGPVIVPEPAAHLEDDVASRIPGREADETATVAPFGYDNRSLMGTAASVGTQIGEHDHPIQERHVRHFLEIVTRNRPGNWRLTRGGA